MVCVRRYSKRSGVIPSGGDIWVRIEGNTAGQRITIHSGEKKSEDGELGYDVYPVGGGPGYFLTEDEILTYYGKEEDPDPRYECPECGRLYGSYEYPYGESVGAQGICVQHGAFWVPVGREED